MGTKIQCILDMWSLEAAKQVGTETIKGKGANQVGHI